MKIISQGNKKILQIKNIIEEMNKDEKDLPLKVKEIISEYIERMEANEEERVKI